MFCCSLWRRFSRAEPTRDARSLWMLPLTEQPRKRHAGFLREQNVILLCDFVCAFLTHCRACALSSFMLVSLVNVAQFVTQDVGDHVPNTAFVRFVVTIKLDVL